MEGQAAAVVGQDGPERQLDGERRVALAGLGRMAKLAHSTLAFRILTIPFWRPKASVSLADEASAMNRRR